MEIPKNLANSVSELSADPSAMLSKIEFNALVI